MDTYKYSSSLFFKNSLPRIIISIFCFQHITIRYCFIEFVQQMSLLHTVFFRRTALFPYNTPYWER